MATFQNLKTLPQSKKILLCEIDIPITVEKWINHEAGIWKVNLAPGDVVGTDDYSLDCYYTPANIIKYKRIGSISVNDDFYTEVNSVAIMRTTPKSYFYDPDDTMLYIRIEHWGLPFDKVIRCGFISGFANIVDPETGGYYENIFYEPRIESIPKLSRKKDRLFYGSLEFQGGDISFHNEDGELDNIVDQGLYGQPVRLKLGFAGFTIDQFVDVYTGIVDKIKRDNKTLRISIKDKRKTLSNKLPKNIISLSDYIYLQEENYDRPKPIIYGTALEVPCICLDGDQTSPSTLTFMFMDTEFYPATGVTNVKSDGVSITPASVDLNSGTFIVNAVDVMDGDNIETVTADVTGAGITNGADVIVDLIEKYAGVIYSSYNYYLAEIENERINCPGVEFAILDETTLIEVIDQICISVDGIFYQKDSGLFSFRRYLPERTVKRIIRDHEWLDDPDFEYPSDEFLTDVTIKYKQRYESAEFARFYDKSNYNIIYNKFKIAKTETIETLLSNSSDAVSKADFILARSDDIYPIIKRKTKIQNIDVEIMDYVICAHGRVADRSLPEDQKDWKKYEIIRIDKDFDKMEITLSMQIDRGPDSEDYEYREAVYQGGFLWGDKIHGDKLFGYTRY